MAWDEMLDDASAASCIMHICCSCMYVASCIYITSCNISLTWLGSDVLECPFIGSLGLVNGAPGDLFCSTFM